MKAKFDGRLRDGIASVTNRCVLLGVLLSFPLLLSLELERLRSSKSDLVGGCNVSKSRDLEMWGCVRFPPPCRNLDLFLSPLRR